MLFHPAVLSLYLFSILISLMVLYAAFYGVQILMRWNLQSGSELQLSLEKKTYLISTLLTYLFSFQLISLFSFTHTVEHLHPLFVGAMCAAGTLYVNAYGYPALLLKLFNFLLAGLWLILNYTDNRGYDYPLIKKKYLLLLLLAPFLWIETILQMSFFLDLKPDVITSCCGTLFSTDPSSVASEIASLPSLPMKWIFYLVLFSTVGLGLFFYRREKGGYLFAVMSGLSLLVSMASLISFISLYFYELPTHHCPFCLLKKEYGYAGYPLYIALLGGAITGMGVGVLMPFRKIVSLKEILPSIQKRAALISAILYLIFLIVATYPVLFSTFRLEGY
jgi:hypothetical protein